jgi:endonuclease III
MGILLSKSEDGFDDSSVIGSTIPASLKAVRKRKRCSQVGNFDAPRQRSSKRQKSSDFATPSSIVCQESYPEHKGTTISPDHIRPVLPMSLSAALEYAPNQSRRKKGRRSRGQVFAEAPADRPENGQVLSPETETLVVSPKRVRTMSHTSKATDTRTPTVHRKRKAPTSPYFGVVVTQLSSPPATPTPSPRRALEARSKVSVIESMAMPSSLPHFRPTSPDEFGLIQEKLRHEPWKMLVAVIFLNVTTAKMALPLLSQLFERWPTPEELSKGTLPLTYVSNSANFEELSAFLYPIGLYNKRAERLIDFSTMWLTNPPRHDVLTKRKGLAKYPATAISHLPGVTYSSCSSDNRWVYMP